MSDKYDIDRQVFWNKVVHFCNYRERCESELRKKLLDMELDDDMRDSLFEEIIEIKMVDDRRYAQHYTESKFRLKKWGRNKIKRELFAKRINPSFINNALSSIDLQDYHEMLLSLIEFKLNSLRITDPVEIKVKVSRYLYSKGYEPSVFVSVLDDCLS